MPIYPASQHSSENVLRDVHDPITQTLRTTATAIIAPGLDVEIDHTEDSIRLGDGTNFLTSTTDGPKVGLDVNIINDLQITDGVNNLDINTDGSINVTVVPGGSINNIYNEVTSVANGILTTIVTYVASTNGKLKRVMVAGTNIAEYTIVINGTINAKKYTYFGNGLSEDFVFDDGIYLTIGDIIQIKTIHSRPYVGNFNANIVVLEI